MRPILTHRVNLIANALFLTALSGAAQSPFLPLEPGNKWTLKHPAAPGKPLVIEVLEQQGSEYRIRFASPFGINEWMIEPRGDKYYMVKFGANGQFMDMPAETVYFDFGAKEGGSWKNAIGKMSMVSKGASVRGARNAYERVLQIRQESKGGKMLFGFAEGQGFVQFGEGKNAFILYEEETKVGGGATQQASLPREGPRAGIRERRPSGQSEPVQHVPTPGSSSGSSNPPPVAARIPPARGQGSGKVLFSVTPNVFANEANTPMNLLKNFERVTNTGMGFLIHNAKWNEFEPKAGQYSVDGLNFNVDTAKRLNIPIAYTFRLIETVDRSMPSDLSKLKWTDRKIEDRLKRVVDEIVRKSEGRIKWFMLGNEIDGYFGRHPNEVGEFAQLFGKIKQYLKSLDSNIHVSSTLMFGGVGTLDSSLRPLDEQYDFLSFTYYPLRSDFTMQDPNVVGRDIDRMRSAARGRKVILQEVGYPSGSKNNSSDDKQAQFYQNVFSDLRANSDMVEAACFWVMADLKDEFVRDLSRFYGIGNSETFKSFLQTLGMFDGNGRPKKAWNIYEREVRR